MMLQKKGPASRQALKSPALSRESANALHADGTVGYIVEMVENYKARKEV